MAVQGGKVVRVDNKDYGSTFYPQEFGGDGALARRSRIAPRIHKTFKIQDIHEKHHEIARLLVLGHSSKDIAKQVGLSVGTINQYKSYPVIKEQVAIMSGARDKEVVDVAKQIRDLAPKCVEVLEGIINDDDASSGIKLKTSLAILDRAGHSVPKNVNVKGVHAVVTGETLDAIKQRALEIASNNEDVIEAEAIESE